MANKTITRISELLVPMAKKNNVTFLAIFGSVAAGRAKRNSDVDLLVRFSKPQSLLDLVRLERVFSKTLGSKIDLVTENAVSPHLKKSIYDNVKVLYGKR